MISPVFGEQQISAMQDHVTVEAVIAALREVFEDAELRDHEDEWDIETINRWIEQLPGRPTQFKGLELNTLSGMAPREDAIGHLRATIRFLVVRQQSPPPTKRRWWNFRRDRKPAASEPIDAEFKLLEGPDAQLLRPFKFKD